MSAYYPGRIDARDHGMKRVLQQSTAFIRAAKRLVKRNPEVAPLIRTTLVTLAEDAIDPVLRTHKLKGDLSGYWACRVGYDLRIIFTLVQYDGAEAILLHTIGTHGDVY